ncbi:tripeptidyl-peptidase 2-like [Vitis riparia]|uniref:tripeptidyl-peptidase 2-like n=1 Tax=Vitis riparia TaxID=96939 RepID=UPI00155AA3FA|nr:tripeptidyl-peptidase 2-like [Vitis riparia]
MQNPIWASNPLESPFLGHPCSKLVIQSTRRLTRRRRKGGERGREWAVRAMPCSSKNTSSSSRDDNGALRAFKLSESTFLASLIPKKGIAADRFVEADSKYDAREVVVAIFDSGVLQVTSGGKPKIFDVLDSYYKTTC